MSKKETQMTKKQVDFTKSMWVNLGHDFGSRVNEYALKTGNLDDQHQVMRELISVALSTDPATAITNAIRIKAYNDVRAWVVQAVYAALNPIYHQLKEIVDAQQRGG